MNDNQNDPQSNIAFNTNTSPDTQASSNPFTGDLKGEFSSDFGTNTNAVSQIFKSSGFSAENRTKYIAIALVGALVIGGLGYYLFSGSSEPFAEDMVTDEGFEDELAEEDAFSEDGDELDEAMVEDEGVGEMSEDMADEAAEVAEDEMAMSEAAESDVPMGAISLISPGDGAKQSYDETMGPAQFSWEGPADRIVFSRSATMQPVVKSVGLGGASSYAFENPYPGTWYWQVENASGKSEIRSFRISTPVRRSFPVSQPTPGATLSGNGGVVSWQAGEKIARYSVELVPAGSSFSNPQYRFGTSGTSVALEGVSPGSYDVRVGAFSEVAGRWEWQLIRGVSVQ